MSWCPKCKNEYRAGITVCPDCNEELLEELTEEMELEFVPVFQTTNAELKEKLIRYLVHCGHKVQEESAVVETEEGEQNAYAILVPQKASKEASQEIRTVLIYDAKQEAGEEDTNSHRPAPEPSTVYVDAKSRYQEYKSSGIMFLIFAALFLIFGILNIAGVITIMASIVSLILVFGTAAAFTYIGITSLMKVTSLKAEASTEEVTTETLMNYLKEVWPKERLLELSSETASEELKYFECIEAIKEDFDMEFPNVDENYLDALIEDYYNSLEL